MENALGEFFVLIPDTNGAVQPLPSTHKQYSLRSFGEFYVPVLTQALSTSDEARLSSFERGDRNLYNFYSSFLLHRIDDTRHRSYVSLFEETDNREQVLNADNCNQVLNAENPKHSRHLMRTLDAPTLTTVDKPIPKSMSGSWVDRVSKAIQEIESTSLGFIKDENDVSELYRDSERSLAGILIRPAEDKTPFQLNFSFGNSKWRRRRSMHLWLLRITMQQNVSIKQVERNILGVSCTCLTFKNYNKCEHLDSVLGNKYNRVRVLSFTVRGLLCAKEIESHDNWGTVRVPQGERDNMLIWQMFKRKQSSSFFSTSSALLYDNRSSRTGRLISGKLLCVLCPGRADKRMMCAHEAALGRRIAFNSRVDENESPSSIYAIEDDPDIAIPDKPIAFERTPGIGNTPVQFSSLLPRRVFCCRGEDVRLMKILAFAYGERLKDRYDKKLFVGVDDLAICLKCEIDARVTVETDKKLESVQLYTLHHGAIPIMVTDFVCRECGSIVHMSDSMTGFFA